MRSSIAPGGPGAGGNCSFCGSEDPSEAVLSLEPKDTAIGLATDPQRAYSVAGEAATVAAAPRQSGILALTVKGLAGHEVAVLLPLLQVPKVATEDRQLGKPA